MSTIEQIKTAIEQLPVEKKAELARWLHGWEDDEWDQQMVADAQAGRLDHLMKEADAEIDANKLRDMP